MNLNHPALSSDAQHALQEYILILVDYIIVLDQTRCTLNNGQLPNKELTTIALSVGEKLDKALLVLRDLKLEVILVKTPGSAGRPIEDVYGELVKDHRQPFITWHPSCYTLVEFTEIFLGFAQTVAD